MLRPAFERCAHSHAIRKIAPAVRHGEKERLIVKVRRLGGEFHTFRCALPVFVAFRHGPTFREGSTRQRRKSSMSLIQSQFGTPIARVRSSRRGGTRQFLAFALHVQP